MILCCGVVSEYVVCSLRAVAVALPSEKLPRKARPKLRHPRSICFAFKFSGLRPLPQVAAVHIFDNLCYLALRFHDMPRYGAVFNDVAANGRKV